MTITRHGTTRGNPSLPLISHCVVHRGIAHTLGVTGEPAGDVRIQTRQALARVDQLLARAGTDKSRLISATVWLADMADFADHNAEWNVWVDPGHPPVRACVQATLWQPDLRVEVMVTAAVPATPARS